jgi:hypothetical protein
VTTGDHEVGQPPKRDLYFARALGFQMLKSNFPSTELLQALNAWLNHDPGLRLERAQALKTAIRDVATQHRTCTVRCYRRIDFPKDPRENERFAKQIRENPTDIPLPLLDLLHTGRLEESVSSWTTDPQVAMNHNNGVQDGHVCVIFFRDPKPEEVWLNLSELIKCPSFLSAVANGNYSAIQHWMTEEREVILEVPTLSSEDVYSWGEIVSDIEELKRVAVKGTLLNSSPIWQALWRSRR